MKKKTIRLMQLSAGIIILAIVLFKVGLKEILLAISKVKIEFFIFAIILYLISLLLGTISIFLMIKGTATKVKFTEVIKSHVLSSAMSLLLPGKIGEASLIYYLKQDKVSIGAGSSVFLANKLITFGVMYILAVIGAFVYLGNTVALQLCILGVIGTLFIWLLITNRALVRFAKKCLGSYAKHLKGFMKITRSFGSKNIKFVFANILVTFLRWFVRAVFVWCLFLGLGVEIGVLAILMLLALETIIALIPITINGLGTKHAVAVYAYQSLFAILPEITLGRLVLGHIIRYGVAAIVLLGVKKKV